MRVSNYEVVLTFEIDETIVLSLGPSLKNLQKNLGGDLIQINVPDDAPPNLPRLILKLDDSVLKLSIDRISISINPPSHVKSSIKKSSKFATQRTESIIKGLLSPMPTYRWSGIITNLEYPSKTDSYKTALEAITPVSEKLVNIERDNKEIASFQLQYGFKEDLYFTNYTIGGYETRKFELPSTKKRGFVQIGPEAYVVTECGIRIILDINNKPGGATKNPLDDIKNIFKKTNEMSAFLPNNLNLVGILT